VVRYLVKELGADVDQANDYGFTSLHIAVKEGVLAMMRVLVKECHADVNKAVNKAEQEGSTHLLFAVWRGSLAIVQCLVEFGADIDRVDRNTAHL
jgi:ankyrin repeat protein